MRSAVADEQQGLGAALRRRHRGGELDRVLGVAAQVVERVGVEGADGDEALDAAVEHRVFEQELEHGLRGERGHRHSQQVLVAHAFQARGDVVGVERVALVAVAQAHRDRHAPGNHLLDAQMKPGALFGRDLRARARQHVFQPAAVAVPGVFDFLVAGLGALVVGEVARDRDIERLLLDQHRALAQIVGGVHEGIEGVFIDARHQALQRVAAGDVHLGEDVVAQDVAEQLALLAALDAQVVRHGVELAQFLLRHQVEQQPRRERDDDRRVGLHAGYGCLDLLAEDAIVVRQIDDVAAGGLRHHELHIGEAADVLGVADVADRQLRLEALDHGARRVGRGVVGDHDLERVGKAAELLRHPRQQRLEVAAAVEGRDAEADDGRWHERDPS